jgi:phosphate starvation-inducible PhoH-like protein
MIELELDVDNLEQLSNICGPLDKNLDLITKSLDVKIDNKDNKFTISGKDEEKVKHIFKDLLLLSSSKTLTQNDIDICIKSNYNEKVNKIIKIKINNKFIYIRNSNQQNFVNEVRKKDCVFAIGPAGTGKTYIAAALAVEALERSDVRRIILVRPMVEAGEKLGFLPGDLTDKIDPYLRPIYDALYEMIGPEKTNKLINNNVIELAPLAFMRGRTLNESFIILDEGQNTTVEQMKMFLTRIGFLSKVIITGDITQIDLVNSNQSGLINAIEVLKNEKQIGFCYFQSTDVVRHKLVQKIVLAYEKFTKK